jgi:hypothetical protein
MARPDSFCITLIVTRDLQGADIRSTAASKNTILNTTEVEQEQVRAALDRVCSSAAVAGSEKLVQFLRFVVETTLRGNAGELKETIIGMSVFGRTPDYDPKVDTVVRSQAWRLRSKLNEYYNGEGATDPVIIDIPRGSYVPFFYQRAALLRKV